DVVELRERKWLQRNAVFPPAAVAKIHEAAAKEKAVVDKPEAYERQICTSCSGSCSGGDRSEDQPSTLSGKAPLPLAKVGDLSKLGLIREGALTDLNKHESYSRMDSNANKFKKLQNVEVAEGDVRRRGEETDF
ncbi:hypothetical protein EV360DRAFT_76575, partial [Lentinula raphanica]